MRKTIAGLAFILPLVMAGASNAEGEGRYQMERKADGFVRLDTVTGEMSVCTEASGQLTCRMAADERAAFEQELDRLTKRVEALEKAQRLGVFADKPRLPTDEEIDRTMGIMERMMRRFMDIVKTLEGGQPADGPDARQDLSARPHFNVAKRGLIMTVLLGGSPHDDRTDNHHCR